MNRNCNSVMYNNLFTATLLPIEKGCHTLINRRDIYMQPADKNTILELIKQKSWRTASRKVLIQTWYFYVIQWPEFSDLNSKYYLWNRSNDICYIQSTDTFKTSPTHLATTHWLIDDHNTCSLDQIKNDATARKRIGMNPTF